MGVKIILLRHFVPLPFLPHKKEKKSFPLSVGPIKESFRRLAIDCNWICICSSVKRKIVLTIYVISVDTISLHLLSVILCL